MMKCLYCVGVFFWCGGGVMFVIGCWVVGYGVGGIRLLCCCLLCVFVVGIVLLIV